MVNEGYVSNLDEPPLAMLENVTKAIAQERAVYITITQSLISMFPPGVVSSLFNTIIFFYFPEN